MTLQTTPTWFGRSKRKPLSDSILDAVRHGDLAVVDETVAVTT
jgi:hypothetical protein